MYIYIYICIFILVIYIYIYIYRYSSAPLSANTRNHPPSHVFACHLPRSPAFIHYQISR